MRDVAGETTVVYPADDVSVGNPLVHTNVQILGDPVFSRWLFRENRSREISFDPVILKRYPPGALLMGHDTYWVLTSGTLVTEQVNPIGLRPEDGFAPLLERLPVETIEGPCLLASRYGASTWGHWTLEILPKIVVAERAWPGRFRFVIPEHIVAVTDSGRSYARAVLESLAAYGIADDRLVQVRPELNLRFSSLHDVGGVWSAAAMNRDICRLMCGAVRGIPIVENKAARFALLRRDTALRVLRQPAEIEARLTKHGFALTEMSVLTFVEQVALFREASTVVAALGSGLSGLVHAPDGVRLLTIAPAGWYDGYFTNIIQDRRALLSDVRGARIWDGSGAIEAAPIDVHAQHVSDGIERIEEADPVSLGDRVIAGETIIAGTGVVVTDLSFRAGGNGLPCLREGWAEPEAGHIWSLACCSRLELPRRAEGELLLELEGFGLVVEPFLPLRPLRLYVNGLEIGQTTFGRELHWLAVVPAAVLGAATSFSVEVHCPIAASPRALGLGEDDRPLGVALVRLRIRDRQAG